MARKQTKTKGRGLAIIAAKVPPSTKTNGKGKVIAPVPDPAAVPIPIALEVTEGTPMYYANYIEVGRTKWDFCLIGARIPAKPNQSKLAEVQATGVFPVQADLAISIPPSIITGLIRALNAQKESYEKEHKIELKETRDETVSQTKQRNLSWRKRL